MNEKSQVELIGRLFNTVELNDDIDIAIEINGFNIYDWFKQNNKKNVKVTLEVFN